MYKTEALMESISSNLHGFLKQIDKNLSLPDQKFLRDCTIGLLRAGSPIVCQIARHLPRQRTRFISRLDRLDKHLVKKDAFDGKLKQSLPEVWLPLFGDDTPIILDLSELAKYYAHKMDYLATVRDGSTGELVNGYWLLELYASVRGKNPIPILLEPFSHQEPYSPGQNPVVLDAVHKIFKRTNNRGVLVVDRGFDAGVMYEDWLDNKYRFVVRLVGKRHLLWFCGGSEQADKGQWVSIQSGQLAEQIATPHYFSKIVKRNGKVILRLSQVGWVKVRLLAREEDLTMVVSRIAGEDTPLMLLTSLPVEGVDDARRILRYYIRRWECEEAIRFLKSQVHLERIRAFRWSAICRLVLVSVVVMIYLCWLAEAHPAIVERLICFSQPLPDKVDFILYRLLTGLTEVMDACFWLRRDLLQRSLWKNP
jgi:hypothetical protein